MGTHPIFESDFDCLTERKIISRKLKSSDEWKDSFGKKQVS